ncbi:nucleoside phosphorylase [Erysipelotrichia bacterium]
MTPHLKLKAGQISPYVLACGDPARAEKIAKLCESYEELAYNREYRTFLGVYKGERITITSHGVGSAGASICFEELIKIGAKVIVRVGTCGSLQDYLGQGDHIIATGAVREDGVTPLLVPLGYPAIADAEVCQAIETACKDIQAPYRRGIMVTSDLFYPGVLPSSLELYSKAGVPGVEMEVSALYVIASLRGVRAGAIATVDGNPLKWDEGNYDPHGEKVTRGKERMLQIGLEAMAAMSRARL